jgi:hypothetical protein
VLVRSSASGLRAQATTIAPMANPHAISRPLVVTLEAA